MSQSFWTARSKSYGAAWSWLLIKLLLGYIMLRTVRSNLDSPIELEGPGGPNVPMPCESSDRILTVRL